MNSRLQTDIPVSYY